VGGHDCATCQANIGCLTRDTIVTCYMTIFFN